MNQCIYNIKDHENIRLLGRHDPSCEVFRAHWTGSGIEVKIRCRSLEIDLDKAEELGTAWIIVLADGAPVARFPVSNGRKWYTVLEGMDAGVEHTVSILRDTQPCVGDLEKPVAMISLRTDGDLLPLDPKPLTIEFVGDSITTGEGIVGPRSAQEWKTVWFSSYNYARMASDRLNAKCRIVSQSGWGVYSSWDGNKDCVIPRIYDEICGAGDCKAPYDFEYQPADIVVINLGTNDGNYLNTCKTPEEKQAAIEEISKAAENFVYHVREKNPDAYILWAYGMCGLFMDRVLHKAVQCVIDSGDKKVGYISLPPNTDEETGSRSHPGIKNHCRAAEAIAEYIEKIL